MHILRSQNTESGEPELNNIGEKYQDKNELILRNTIIYTRLKKTIDKNSGVWPHLPVQLENGTWTNFNPIPFF